MALFAVFITLLSGMANLILRLLGLPALAEPSLHSSTEIGWLVAQSARAGAVRAEVGDRLHNALRFAGRTAADMMVPRVRIRAVPDSISLDALRRVVREADHTRIPVYRDSLDTILGVIHAKDVLLRTRGGGPLPRPADLIRPIPLVPWSARALSLLETMRAEHAGMVVVLDEHGGTAGIVTLEDLVEEIVGELEDEHDRARVGVVRTGRSITFDASLRPDELLDRTGISVPDGEEYDTVAGFVTDQLDRIPELGDEAVIDGGTLRVERVVGTHVERLRFTPDPSAEPPKSAHDRIIDNLTQELTHE
jgi:CBS domain containing-hemolysin-like protein